MCTCGFMDWFTQLEAGLSQICLHAEEEENLITIQFKSWINHTAPFCGLRLKISLESRNRCLKCNEAGSDIHSWVRRHQLVHLLRKYEVYSIWEISSPNSWVQPVPQVVLLVSVHTPVVSENVLADTTRSVLCPSPRRLSVQSSWQSRLTVTQLSTA